MPDIKDPMLRNLYHQVTRRKRVTQREALNLDGMWPDDLEAVAADKNYHLSVRKYAAHKAKAMRHREAGDINKARILEDRLDQIYDVEIPKRLRW